MTGEAILPSHPHRRVNTAGWREPARPQPGGRAAAPGDLALVQSFINSHYDLVVDHGRDLLGSPAGLADWLAQRGLIAPDERPVGPGELRRAVGVREGLRALARANADPGASRHDALQGLNQAARQTPVQISFDADGPRWSPAALAPVDRMLGVVLAITAAAMLDGRWARLKACPGEHCGWAFYDQSRNQSGRWCAMAVCGSRAKARAHYRRRRTGVA